MPDQILLAVIAVVNLITALTSIYAARTVKKAKENIEKIEVATNSMKDALVAATAKASFSEGAESQRKNPT